MKNNKGFSLVELLAVVAIMSILFGIGLAAYGRYIENTRNKAVTALLESSINATEEFLMDHPGYTEVNFDDLVEEEYLESSQDPFDKNQDCAGTVRISTEVVQGDQVELNNYIVDMCCSKENIQYNSETKRRVQTGMCMANFQERDYLETGVNPTPNGNPSGSVPATNNNCATGNVKTRSFSIYTMDYLNRVCTKQSNGKYGGCLDSTNPYGNINFPCRRYQYYQFGCKCIYSKITNKYCGYQITSNSSHIMRIKYLENANGHAACESDLPEDFNSYVHDVCWEGRYKNGATVMTFHGYQFFLGKSEGYKDFRPNGTWFHDNISGITLEDRVQRKYDKVNDAGKIIPNEDQGCRDTCVRFTEALSGKPK